MKIEAPYKALPGAPADADKVEGEPADKPETQVEEPKEYAPDKPKAPDAEPEEVEEEAEETEKEEAPPEVPDADLIRMRADYSRKTDALARQREQVEREKAGLADKYGVYERVDQLLADNPGLAKTHSVEQLVAMLQDGTAPTPSPGIPPEYAKKLAAIEGRLRNTTDTLFRGQVQATMKILQSEYALNAGEVKAVIETAVMRGKLDNPEAAPEDIHFDLDLIASKVASKRASVDGQKKLVKQLKEKGKAASGGAPSTTTVADTSQPRVKGWDALTKHFVAEAKRHRAG